MPRYSASMLAALAATNAPLLTLHTGTNEIRLLEVWFWVATAGTSAEHIALYRPSNTPVATTSELGRAEDPADAASLANIDNAWSTAPTIAASGWFRRVRTHGTVGDPFTWRWDDDVFIVPPSGWIVFWNHGTATAGQYIFTLVWDE